MEIIPAEAILQSFIPSDAAFRFYCLLCQVKDSRNPDVYLTREDAETKFGFSKTRYFAVLNELEEKKWITKSDKVGQIQNWFLIKGFDNSKFSAKLTGEKSRKWNDYLNNSPENGTISAKNSPENGTFADSSLKTVPKTELESPENGTIIKKIVPKTGLPPAPPLKEKSLNKFEEKNKEVNTAHTREDFLTEMLQFVQEQKNTLAGVKDAPKWLTVFKLAFDKGIGISKAQHCYLLLEKERVIKKGGWSITPEMFSDWILNLEQLEARIYHAENGEKNYGKTNNSRKQGNRSDSDLSDEEWKRRNAHLLPS